MKLMLGALCLVFGLAFAYSIGDVNGHWCAQNFVAGITGGLIASVGLRVA